LATLPRLKRGHRGSRPQRYWVATRRFVQYLALFGFLALFLRLPGGDGPAPILGVPMRLDPLAMAAHALAARTLLASSLVSLGVIVLTLLVGRAWCGWLCPLGTVLDLFSSRARRTVRVPESWRAVKHLLLEAIFVSSLCAALVLLVLDPISLLTRTLATSLWPALEQGITTAERALYRLPALRPLVSALDGLLRPLIGSSPAYFRGALVPVGLLGGLLALNAFAPRFWCRYLCPLGALLGLLSRVGLVRREVDERCTACDACVPLCPTGTIRPDKHYASDPAECTMCLECLSGCPQQAVVFRPHWRPARPQEYDPRRRAFLATLAATVLGVVLLRGERAIRRRLSGPIRPPGADEERILSRCLRCGACSRACPTGAIQPALGESGWEGVWTPVLVFRIGYCAYSCNACGQVCPVQAIPSLSLEEKREQVLGWADIDRERCLPWAEGIPCIVCEEMCPVPQKAVALERVELPGENGAPILLQRPHVVRKRCIGCGICEYQCPVSGPAAIRVYSRG